jgi:hypothetical protein
MPASHPWLHSTLYLFMQNPYTKLHAILCNILPLYFMFLCAKQYMVYIGRDGRGKGMEVISMLMLMYSMADQLF